MDIDKDLIGKPPNKAIVINDKLINHDSGTVEDETSQVPECDTREKLKATRKQDTSKIGWSANTAHMMEGLVEDSQDTREKLEADMIESCEHFYTTERRYDELIKLLDRQAAITKRECSQDAVVWVGTPFNRGYGWRDIRELLDKIDRLTDERDELRLRLKMQSNNFVKLKRENSEMRDLITKARELLGGREK